jgi:hypothetical protein
MKLKQQRKKVTPDFSFSCCDSCELCVVKGERSSRSVCASSRSMRHPDADIDFMFIKLSLFVVIIICSM